MRNFFNTRSIAPYEPSRPAQASPRLHRKMSPSILMVLDHLEENGGLRVAHDIARHLPRQGQPVEMFVLREGAEPRLRPAPEVHLTVGSRRPGRLRQVLPEILLRLLRHARRSALVFSPSEDGLALLLGFAVARLTGRNFAVMAQASLENSLREWVPPRLRAPTRWVISRADLVVCISEGLVPEVVATGLPPSRTAIVPVGIDVDRIIAAGAAAASGFEPPFIVAVGRLTPAKGFDVLIDAFARVRDRLPGHRLLIIGEGLEREHLEARIAELGLGDRVVLAGHMDNPHPTMRRADLFVLSSRSEGMPLVLLEAMAHGLPIIATDCGSGTRDLLENGRCGRIVPREDAQALAEAMAAHIADASDLRARAERGPERARAFSPERWTNTLRTTFAPLMEDRR